MSCEEARQRVDEISQNDHWGVGVYAGAFSSISVGQRGERVKNKVPTGYSEDVERDDTAHEKQDE